MNSTFTSRVILVFGATGGIGSELCRQLSAERHKVVLAARSGEKLSQLGQELNTDSFPLDASDADQVEACFAQTRERHGRIDGVANCIGSLLLKPAHLTTDQDWASVIATNLTTSFIILRAAVKQMRAEGGSIVLVSSAAATRGLANHEAIAAAKAGIIGLIRSAAATYAPNQIRVNGIAPGLVRTPLTAALTRT